MARPYEAKATNVTFQRGPKGERETQWIVTGGDDLKGIKVGRFTGSKAECQGVADVLNKVNHLK